jgi:hypothetical protein
MNVSTTGKPVPSAIPATLQRLRQHILEHGISETDGAFLAVTLEDRTTLGTPIPGLFRTYRFNVQGSSLTVTDTLIGSSYTANALDAAYWLRRLEVNP